MEKKIIKKAKKTVTKKEAPVKDTSTVSVYDQKGGKVESMQLDKTLFDGSVNKGIMYQAMLMYNANQRGGNASTKTREFVSGGGKKPFKQKGTGQARAGSTRSPLWRGGGKVFGPHPRDFHYSVPKKILRAALLSSINAKMNDGQVICIEQLAMKEPKTREFQAIIDSLKITGRCLFVTDSVDDNLKRASRNIADVSVKSYRDINMMDVMRSGHIVMTRQALLKLPERFKA